ncbi:CLU domain [Dillenia turbinata]|uniref:CLU domain n=1 Tax=Dillenia turbinata TaxID=194707 RepID=A0AAN8VGP0_9MAGN
MEKENERDIRFQPVAAVANGAAVAEETNSVKAEGNQPEAAANLGHGKQGDLHLYPISLKTIEGRKLELQLNQVILLWMRDNLFLTLQRLVSLHVMICYCTQRWSNFNEIGEVADITTGNCTLEMVAASYDDRSIRAYIHRTRELVSLSNLYASLSTSLALQHETTHSTNASSVDSVKTEVPDPEGLGYMEDVSGFPTSLLSPCSKDVQCVGSIVFSSFNPSPSYHRLVGDLIYLDVVTLEETKFFIMGTTKMFYEIFSIQNLLKLIMKRPPLLDSCRKSAPTFQEILERKASAHQFENVQFLLPPNSWLGLYPVPDHKRDAARAEDALTLSYGSELIGMQRDWNEELQSCREFPHTTPQEKILRDRALYKVTSDFVDAAISGAIGVINRCIPPINPTDPECFHMYVHNNIFFSFAVDDDLNQLSRRHPPANKLKASSDDIIKDSKESTPEVGEGPKSDKLNGSNTEANGVAKMVPDASTEMQLAESEQATFASANNDLKGTKLYQEANIPGLYHLAMAIIDYRGYRVVAQSVLPGILQGDKSDSLLYGSVDNGKKICWNEDFHAKVAEAAKHLHLKEHTVLDGSGNVFKLAAPVECKGIVGSDDRHYLLDLMRVTPRDANYTGPASRFCVLRPELKAEAAEKSKCKAKPEGELNIVADSPDVATGNEPVGTVATAASASDLDGTQRQQSEVVHESGSVPADTNESCEDLLFNPNVFTEFKLAGSPEEVAADEENVRKASSYLMDVVIPKFLQDLFTLEVSPMDGQTLTEALHAHGINLRYIGKVAEKTKNFPHLWDLCCHEIAVRSAKHIFKGILRETTDHDLGPAISHLFNCFFGNCQGASEGTANGAPPSTHEKEAGSHQTSVKYSKGKGRWKSGASARNNQSSYINVTSESLWSDIQEFAKLKYQFKIPEDSRSMVKKVSVLRNLCLKVGITIAARKYDLGAATPFETSDILDLQPVVKHSIPACTEAKDLIETGKAQLAEGLLSEAYQLFSEAFSILQQHERKTYEILVKNLGEEDSRTRDAENWMKTFEMRALQMDAQKQKGQAINAASTQRALDILKANPDLILQAATAAGGVSGSSSSAVNKTISAALMGETRGKGFDERAARAAAEIRKKAAARGLLIRQHGVPVQALPPLTQLLNMINSGMTPDAVDSKEANGAKKEESNGHPSNGGGRNVNGNQSNAGQTSQAPAGLGKGLGLLDAKKKKSKSKET